MTCMLVCMEWVVKLRNCRRNFDALKQKKRCLKLVTNWFGFLYFQKYGMIPNIFRYGIPHQANPYQKRNSNSIHYGFRGQNHNPDLVRFNPIPIQSIPMKSRFKHLANGVYGTPTKRRLQDLSIPDFLTTIHFNHELFNHDLDLRVQSVL